MGLLEKIQFNFLDSVGMVTNLIKQWEPIDCKTEKANERSLYDFLHEQLEEIQVTKQYAKGRIHADLVVGDKVIIEIKNNLNTTGKYQRLIGQLADYKEWEGQIIVILAGDSDPNLRKQLTRYFESERGLLFDEEKVTVIDK